jgi:gas vesicle protein
MTTRTKWILGIVGATAAGVAIGLMLAPEKGSDLRKKVSETAGDWAGHLTDLFANAKGELQNLKGKGTKAAGNVSESFS